MESAALPTVDATCATGANRHLPLWPHLTRPIELNQTGASQNHRASSDVSSKLNRVLELIKSEATINPSCEEELIDGIRRVYYEAKVRKAKSDYEKAVRDLEEIKNNKRKRDDQ